MLLSRLFRRSRPPEAENDPNAYGLPFKVLLVGDKGTGKSSFVKWLKNQTFTGDDMPTIGVDCASKKITINGTGVKCNIWDISGDVRYRIVTRGFYTDCVGVIIFYDVTKRSSFENLQDWCDAVKQLTENASTIIVGSKCDLKEERVVGYITAKTFADKVGLPLIEVSSKTGTNVEQAYVTLIADILEKGGTP